MTRERAPSPSIIVCHQIDVIKHGTKLLHLELSIVLRTSRCSNRQLEVVSRSILPRVSVELIAYSLEEKDHVIGLSVVGGILPVDIDTVKAPVLHKSYGALGKSSSGGGGTGSCWEVG
ncbi:unnamed protein product [Fusarium venenatum]|uniref:Uncharacterized protein n=1 Tax=Fusarium venenatum TaxID=56646 RepID=A0A2L2T3G4_9HYPO|nr:uncharacterized protein FVRRES_06589 [Fusarium venenatum]CEI62153.1 unnamed protein product [Fusarium venenatum]